MSGLRVLVACEFSGVVRDAFRAKGHDATSCDLLPTEQPGPHHVGDVRDILNDGWDLMIAHPPCTYLAKAGVRWLYDQERFPGRWRDLIEGAVFFRTLLTAPIPHIAVENPGMHRWASQIIGCTADQVIHPWMFGHTETKATGLWLRGLPPLMASEDAFAATMALPVAERSRIHYAAPGPDRGKRRSVTYAGVARAMADQWSSFISGGIAA